MGAEEAFERYVRAKFDEQYVPRMFEEIVRQFLIRRNRAGAMRIPFRRIGTYFYDDPRTKRNGQFDVVTLDDEGYVFYEVKFRAHPMTRSEIEKKKLQVAASPMPCTRFGFISRSGFADDVKPEEGTVLWTLDDVYAPVE